MYLCVDTRLLRRASKKKSKKGSSTPVEGVSGCAVDEGSPSQVEVSGESGAGTSITGSSASGVSEVSAFKVWRFQFRSLLHGHPSSRIIVRYEPDKSAVLHAASFVFSHHTVVLLFGIAIDGMLS